MLVCWQISVFYFLFFIFYFLFFIFFVAILNQDADGLKQDQCCAGQGSAYAAMSTFILLSSFALFSASTSLASSLSPPLPLNVTV